MAIIECAAEKVNYVFYYNMFSYIYCIKKRVSKICVANTKAKTCNTLAFSVSRKPIGLFDTVLIDFNSPLVHCFNKTKFYLPLPQRTYL